MYRDCLADALAVKCNQLGVWTYILQAIGDVQQFRDDRDAALKSYEQALNLFRAVGAKLGEANIYLSLGAIQRVENHLGEARTYFQNAFQSYQVIGDGYSQARALYRLGDCAADEKNWNDALQAYRQAEAIWLSIGLDDLVKQILKPRIEKAEKRGA